MALIEWNKSLSVDIKNIDEQHKKLLNYMNSLYNALNKKKEKKILMSLFKDLDNYTKTHFTLEEAYFQKFDYNQTKEHIQEHKEFIKKLEIMKEQIPRDYMDAEDLLEFLVNWITNHIRKTDHKYIECFHNHGIK